MLLLEMRLKLLLLLPLSYKVSYIPSPPPLLRLLTRFRSDR